MGHLINATAFRLGWSKNWADSWFSNYIYYSEYLYSIFKVRLFLIYFFCSRAMIKNGILYSHLEISTKKDALIVNIFYYDASLIRSYNNLSNEFTVIAKEKFRTHKKLKIRYLRFWKIFVFLAFLLNLRISSRKYVTYYRLLFLLLAFKKFSLNNILINSHHIFNNFSFKRRLSFVLLFTVLFRKIVGLVRFLQAGSKKIWNTVLSRFFFAISSFHWNYDLFLHFKKFFIYLFKKISIFHKIEVKFYIVSNVGVTSGFISRYVTSQLSYGKNVKDIMGTLRLEFRRLRQSSLEKFSPHYINKTFSKNALKNSFKKTFSINLISNVLLLVSRLNWINFLKSNSWVSMNFIDTSCLIMTLSNGLNFIVSFFFLLSKNYKFFYFFFNNINKITSLHSFLLPNTSKFTRLIGFYNFLLSVEIFILNFNSSSISNRNANFFLNLSFFRLSNLALGRFINYRYFNHNKTRTWFHNGVNYQNLRNYKLRVFSSLLGFKVLCAGRFSRRQRSSWIYFQDFTVPLSSIKADIDYSFAAIPIENSLVSVKVWIYKNSKFPSFYFKAY